MHPSTRIPRLLLALAILPGLLAAPTAAQRPPAQLDGSEILHRMQKLGVVGSALYVGAHPDDENTRLISYLSNGLKVRTAYLSLTRGDGGQNLIGTELGEALGILRTQELLEARRIDGGEQFFTRAADFGYSKNSEETFAQWGRESVLADVVRVVRTFRPDVIITRFSTDGSGGHGHHTASAILAQEAFDLAADPGAFPEQIAEGLEPWQAKRLFFNASTWWNPKLAEVAEKDPSIWVRVDVGGYDPLLGASYTEIAGRSRSQHKSQGFGAAETRGELIEYLRLEKGADLATPDLFDRIELGWARFVDAYLIERTVRELVAAYDPKTPEQSVPILSKLVREFDRILRSKSPGSHWAILHRNSARELILQVLGAVIEIKAKQPSVAAGDSLTVTLSAMQRRSGVPLTVFQFHSPDSEGIPANEALSPNRPWTQEFVYKVPADRTFDQPYWLRTPPDHATVRPHRGPHWIEPMIPGAALFRCAVKLPDGPSFLIDLPSVHSWVDRVAGERMRAVGITPVASIEIADPVAIASGERTRVSVDIVALREDLGGRLEASAPDGWSIDAASQEVGPLRRGERRTMQVGVSRTKGARGGPLHLKYTGAYGASDRTMHVIDYSHILPQTWYSPADVLLVPLDVAVDAKTVGYIEGAGDDVAMALRRLAVTVERIDPATASPADLDGCDAIVTGIRAYNTVPALARIQPMLLAYVEKGGTLLVQYNTNGSDLVIDAKKIGPYPFVLTRDRVTVEEAPPTFLAPDHPLMTTPNRLGPADFEGWVQERGLYFPGELDPHYTALIAWNDPGEEPKNGALIACDYGKGRFVYTGISLFRQLPAGVPGAYRLLANLVARRTNGN
ncbi:MAG: PIG-L family deacetylase [Planctomycetota bacterium]